MQRLLLSVLSFFTTFFLSAQQIDVQHYKFTIELKDENDTIKGEAEISMKLLQPVKLIELDLVQAKEKGMIVNTVKGENVLSFRQENNKLIIVPKKLVLNETQTFLVNYSGIPTDGLIISRNKYGDRTFFADNWPNRAHCWIPCNDMPSDKATFEFIVIAPNHYGVISNGIKVEEKDLPYNKRLTHWKEDVSLSTKVMVIGVARFAVKTFNDSPSQVPVSAWVYLQDSTKGFYDYGVAPKIVKFFSEFIAPFPYNKLANVQSKTIFGGMENASSIFYAEESVTGNRKWEDVIAHEIVHQWFGDMASEKSFAHLWLSEGFATYLTDIYIQAIYGKDSSLRRLEKERQDIIEFARQNDHSVVDSTTNLMSLLNVNSYQKGSWILHMLNEQTGDKTFQKIIQAYYQKYKGSNADTRDFELIAEKVSGMDLKWFFDEWLYQPGLPIIKVKWKFDNNANPTQKGIMMNFEQLNTNIFRFPLEISLVFEDGSKVLKTMDINSATQNFKIKSIKKPVRIILDPGIKVLFSGSLEEIHQ